MLSCATLSSRQNTLIKTWFEWYDLLGTVIIVTKPRNHCLSLSYCCCCLLLLSSSLLQRSQYSRTKLQCSYESKVKTGLTDHLINSYKVSYRADLESYEDLIRLSVRRFLSQISSSVPWLTITPVGLWEWIRFVENHTSAYPVLGNHNHHGQRHCHQTLRADWCYREAWDWKYFGGDEGGSPRHLALAVLWLLLSSEQGTSYFI